jgi:hypothetical protein
MALMAILVADLSFSQTKNASRIKVAYSQASDSDRFLDGSIVVRVKRYEPLTEAQVLITRLENEEELEIGKVITDGNGEFRFKLTEDIANWVNEEGEVEFTVTYQGNDTIRKASRSMSIIPARLDMAFKEGEEENLVEVRAVKLNIEGEYEPVDDIKIDVYVKSLFNPLLIGTGTTNSRGIARIAMPDDLPGNRQGSLSVLVKINEHESYGTLIKEGEINWGIPYVPPEVKQRGLGDTDAPLWMVYTLIVLLSAVWFHYLYVIYMIIRIKMSK